VSNPKIPLLPERPDSTTPAPEPERFDLRSADIAADRRNELFSLFPEARTEGGKIDFDRLKLALGESVDVGKERYGMNWPGKVDCFKSIQTPSVGTLRPVRKESVNFDATENLIIEGDNLEVLKLLQKSYLGKIKMIYIDPPYNTGNDFIYPDNYSESLQTYLEYTGQVDDEGKRFGTNTEADGRFHSKWMNMMYPRLYLARNLLRQDGVIFISIDDHELDNLLRLCNDIFGEENHIATLGVQVNPRGRHLDDFIARTHEYVVAFAKDAAEPSTMYGLEKEGRMVDEYDKTDARGRYREIGLRNRNQSFNPTTRPKLFYPLYVDPGSGAVSVDKSGTHTAEVWPITTDGVKTCWTWGKEKVTADAALLTGRQVEDGSWRIFRKDYLEGEDGASATTLPKSLWLDKELNNDYGRKAMQDLFGEAIIDFPKPPELLKKLIRCGTAPGDTVLDFFAGSGTTGHAILELSAEGFGTRPVILVQLPEPTDRKDFATIADVTRERFRRVAKRLDDKGADELSLASNEDTDRGFRAFALSPSNFTEWDAALERNAEALKEQLELHVDHVRQGRTDDDILYELLLKSGFPLTTAVEKKNVAGTTVYAVADGALIICLDRALTLEVIRGIADLKPERVVCLDEGFAGNDQLKTNAVQTFKTKSVTSFKTV
jgi:adenine-specific DNA-methyltransferase